MIEVGGRGKTCCCNCKQLASHDTICFKHDMYFIVGLMIFGLMCECPTRNLLFMCPKPIKYTGYYARQGIRCPSSAFQQKLHARSEKQRNQTSLSKTAAQVAYALSTLEASAARLHDDILCTGIVRRLVTFTADVV